jgi:hypothetical protein
MLEPAFRLGVKILFCWIVRFTGPTQVIELAIPESARDDFHEAVTP